MACVTPGRDAVANPGSIFPRAKAEPWIPGSAFGGPGMTTRVTGDRPVLAQMSGSSSRFIPSTFNADRNTKRQERRP